MELPEATASSADFICVSAHCLRILFFAGDLRMAGADCERFLGRLMHFLMRPDMVLWGSQA